MKQPRDYQKESKLAIHRCLASNRSTLLVLATGLGKTVVFSQIVAERLGNALVLAHRRELVEQMARSVEQESDCPVVVEMAEQTASTLRDLWRQRGLIVAGSIQSMSSPSRVRKYANTKFDTIVIDEAHRATSRQYRELVDREMQKNPDCKLLGVTATPNRTDKRALGLVFDSVAYDMRIRDGIHAGWLVDVEQAFCHLGDIDLDSVTVVRNEFGQRDFKAKELEALLSKEGTLHAMSEPLIDHTKNGQQAIVFAASVRHAELWALVLNGYRPGCAMSINGNTDKSLRDRAVQNYKDGTLQFLVNYGVFTEGFDAPSTNIVAMGRMTKSELVYSQMLGRGTRPLPGVVDGPGKETIEARKDAIAASAKPRLLVLDFVGNTKHKTVSASDVLGGDYDDKVKARANKLLGERKGNVRDALEKAKASIDLEMEERKRLKVLVKTNGYRLERTGEFGPEHVGVAQEKLSGGATEKQVKYLMSLGVSLDAAKLFTHKQASAVIDKLSRERCTDWQARLLRQQGLDPRLFTVASAREYLDRKRSEVMP